MKIKVIYVHVYYTVVLYAREFSCIHMYFVHILYNCKFLWQAQPSKTLMLIHVFLLQSHYIPTSKCYIPTLKSLRTYISTSRSLYSYFKVVIFLLQNCYIPTSKLLYFYVLPSRNIPISPSCYMYLWPNLTKP